MSNMGKPERATQNRVIKLFTDTLDYTYLGKWQDRESNSNIEESQLEAYLTETGYSPDHISCAIHQLRVAAGNTNRSLHENNKAVYGLLRYGVQVKVSAGENTETVKLLDWDSPQKNHFAIAEEVTLKGNHERRPDLVLYVKGLAIGVIELKNSRADIGKAVR